MSAQDGGPAFPTEAMTHGEGKAGPSRYTVPGMTLRDYFAGQALAGISDQQYTHQFTAQISYAIADAMLAERDKP